MGAIQEETGENNNQVETNPTPKELAKSLFETEKECCGGECGCSEEQPEQEEENKASIELASIVNFGSLKENDVVIFRMNEPTMGLMRALQAMSERYGKTLQDKNITVMILGKDDSIETADEKQMAKFGWEKKDKSRIITLDKL